MPFPEIKGVRYDICPIDNVVCLLNFSQIYKIDSEPPSKFQESISLVFPEAKPPLIGEVGVNADPNQPPLPIQTSMIYLFGTEDGVWEVSLSRTDLCLRNNGRYTSWKEFDEKMKVIIDALLECYPVKCFTRVGIRYTNVFIRSKLNLECEWADLIEKPFCGALSTEIYSNVENISNVCEIGLQEGRGKARVMTTLVTGANDPNHEICFMLINDLFILGRVSAEKIHEELKFLHLRATRLFRFVITKKLHNAMGPEEYDENE